MAIPTTSCFQQPASAISYNNSAVVNEILTSKIQYLDYQINQIISPFLLEELECPEKIAFTSTDLIMQEIEKLFIQFEQVTYKKYLLRHVKKILTNTNATLVLAMLSNNYLYEFSKHEIEIILNGK